MCWTFWRFSAWMSQITCPMLYLQHDSRNFFPLASHFMTFLLGMHRNQTLKLKKQPTSFQVLLTFCSFTFPLLTFLQQWLTSLGFLPVQTFLWKHLCHKQRVATALCVGTRNSAVTFSVKLIHANSYKVWHWLSLTFRFAVIKYQRPSRQDRQFLAFFDRGVTRTVIKQITFFLGTLTTPLPPTVRIKKTQ